MSRRTFPGIVRFPDMVTFPGFVRFPDIVAFSHMVTFPDAVTFPGVRYDHVYGAGPRGTGLLPLPGEVNSPASIC